MRYDFICPQGHEVELVRKMADRDKLAVCPKCNRPMKRKFCQGMAILWQGRFHDPWAQKRDMDGLGPSW